MAIRRTRAKRNTQPQEALELSELAERLGVWRGARRRGQRIPEELRKAATELGHIHGLGPTATGLKLNYYDLQRRLDAGRVSRTGHPTPPTFMELLAAPSTPGLGEGGTLEMVQASGARLTLRLRHARAKELEPLVQLFLRQRL